MSQQISHRNRLLSPYLSWLLAVALGIALLLAVGFSLAQYPRRVLLSDVGQAEKIIVRWVLPEGYRGSRDIAFELGDSSKSQLCADLKQNLGVDYFRTRATGSPTIGIYLFNSKNEPIACYGIRCARGGGRCPSMESIRQTAAKGRPLSDIEADSLFNDRHRQSKWPAILPGRYDFVLATTGTDSNPLWEERRIVPRDPNPEMRHTLVGHLEPVLSVAYSPDGKTIASGSSDKTVKLWDVTTGENIASLEGHTWEIRSVAFSPDGRTLASAGGRDRTLKLWDVATRKNIATLSGHGELVVSVAYSPDGKTIASGSWDTTIKLWDAATGRSIHTLNGHSNYVSSVKFSPNGKTIASGSADKTVKLWDISSGKNIATLTGHSAYVSSVAFSPDGKILASGSADGTVKLWDLANDTNSATLNFPALSAYGDVSVVFSPDGKTLASAGLGRKITLWDVNRRQRRVIFSGYSMDADRLAFSPDGKMLVSCSDMDHFDKAVNVWDMTIIQGRQATENVPTVDKPM